MTGLLTVGPGIWPVRCGAEAGSRSSRQGGGVRQLPSAGVLCNALALRHHQLAGTPAARSLAVIAEVAPPAGAKGILTPAKSQFAGPGGYGPSGWREKHPQAREGRDAGWPVPWLPPVSSPAAATATSPALRPRRRPTGHRRAADSSTVHIRPRRRARQSCTGSDGDQDLRPVLDQLPELLVPALGVVGEVRRGANARFGHRHGGADARVGPGIRSRLRLGADQGGRVPDPSRGPSSRRSTWVPEPPPPRW